MSRSVGVETVNPTPILLAELERSSGMGYVPLVPLTDRAIRRCVEGGGVGDDIRSAAYLCREFKKQTVCFVTFLGPR